MINDFSILVVEQGETQESILADFFRQKNQSHCFACQEPTEALEILNKNKKIELLVTDLFLPDKSGLELIRQAVGQNPNIVPITLIPPGNRRLIVESLQAGAHFYAGIPYDYQEILEVIKICLEYQKLLQLNLAGK
jgi:DNA-binding NtrC family response regulator